MSIGESLKRFRENFGLTQKQIADSINIFPQLYYKYENSKSVPSAEVIIKIADAYGVSTDYLLGRSDTPKNPVVSDADKKLVDAVIACELALKNALQEHGVN